VHSIYYRQLQKNVPQTKNKLVQILQIYLTKKFLKMACNVTAGSGMSRGLEDALGAKVQGKLQNVESDLPEDLKNEASLRFQAAIDSHLPIGSATEKVQEEVLSKCNDVFKGKRYKGFIRFEYESNVITININKFAGGNCQFSSGIGTKKMVCPDPFMGRLSDPNMHR